VCKGCARKFSRKIKVDKISRACVQEKSTRQKVAFYTHILVAHYCSSVIFYSILPFVAFTIVKIQISGSSYSYSDLERPEDGNHRMKIRRKL
jgi:hypothetical protein